MTFEMSDHSSASRYKSQVMYVVCIAMTATIVAVLGFITVFLFFKGISSLSVAFFTNLPINTPPGMKNGLVGTLMLIGSSSAVGIPIGMLTGVYLAEYDRGSWLVAPVRFVCDVLTGVPSIVVGVLGYELLVKPLNGDNGWAATFALAFIMIPIVARTTEEMLRLVPMSYREASIALGATKARTILTVVIPGATGSIVTGIMLAVARVAGETAPLLFTAGAGSYLNTNFNESVPSLTTLIYRFREDPKLEPSAWTGILVLILLISLLNVGVRYFSRARK